eukprot:gene18748-25276_t
MSDTVLNAFSLGKLFDEMIESAELMGGDAVVQARISQKSGDKSVCVNVPAETDPHNTYIPGKTAKPSPCIGLDVGAVTKPKLPYATANYLDLSTTSSPMHYEHSPDHTSTDTVHPWESCTANGASHFTEQQMQLRISSGSQASTQLPDRPSPRATTQKYKPGGLRTAPQQFAQQEETLPDRAKATGRGVDGALASAWPSNKAIPWSCPLVGPVHVTQKWLAAANSADRPPLSPSSKQSGKPQAGRSHPGSVPTSPAPKTSPHKACSTSSSFQSTTTATEQTPFARFILPSMDSDPSASLSHSACMSSTVSGARRSSSQLFHGPKFHPLPPLPSSTHSQPNPTQSQPQPYPTHPSPLGVGAPTRMVMGPPGMGLISASASHLNAYHGAQHFPSFTINGHCDNQVKLRRNSAPAMDVSGQKRVQGPFPANSGTQPKFKFEVKNLQQTATPQHMRTIDYVRLNEEVEAYLDQEIESFLDPSKVQVCKPAKSATIDLDPERPDEGWAAATLSHRQFANDPVPIIVPGMMMDDIRADLGKIRYKLLQRRKQTSSSSSEGYVSQEMLRTLSAPAMTWRRPDLGDTPNKRPALERPTVSNSVSLHSKPAASSMEADASSAQQKLNPHEAKIKAEPRPVPLPCSNLAKSQLGPSRFQAHQGPDMKAEASGFEGKLDSNLAMDPAMKAGFEGKLGPNCAMMPVKKAGAKLGPKCTMVPAMKAEASGFEGELGPICTMVPATKAEAKLGPNCTMVPAMEASG